MELDVSVAPALRTFMLFISKLQVTTIRSTTDARRR